MSEQAAEIAVGSTLVNGRIDRVDRHRKSGMLRILDYKTSDSAKPPAELHLPGGAREDSRDYALVEVDGKVKRWADLQLPLYVRMLAPLVDANSCIEAGYFNLPRESDGARVDIWQELTGSLLSRADDCAEGVIADIQSRRFWPPATRVQYDEFESLFPADAVDCIDHEAFMRFLEGWRT
jgi:ATP-dependent helicase/nuclease subunit B